MIRTVLLPLFFAAALVFSPFALAAGDTELNEINSLYAHTQYAAALDRIDAYLAKKPNDASARFLKGLILTGQHKDAQAIDVFTALNEDFPELAEPYNNLAALYAAQGHYRKARKALETAVHINPNYAVAEENLGDIYAKMAGIAYTKVIKLDSKNTTAPAKLSLITQIFVPHPAPVMEDKLSAKPAK
ncbi:MAG: tetratricopeptide repeat protein [Burkholderiales bacterium]